MLAHTRAEELSAGARTVRLVDCYLDRVAGLLPAP